MGHEQTKSGIKQKHEMVAVGLIISLFTPIHISEATILESRLVGTEEVYVACFLRSDYFAVVYRTNIFPLGPGSNNLS